MSGHSKWSKIHRQKGVADSKRGALFTKLAKTVAVAAKIGGGDPSTNFKLQLAVDQARAGNMPKDNIERAIKRGTGELEGGIIEELTYEGFGPGGSAFIIECLTDNRNRTSSAIRHIFSKYGGKLGTPNSVARMFEQKGIVRTQSIDENLELELIDAGVSDVIAEEGGSTILTSPNDLKKIKDLLEQKGLTVEYAEIEQIPHEKKDVDEKAQKTIEKMFDEFDSDEDVNNFYTDAKI